jgi:DNA helicase II / ATP-dependent DNA helicase PcrA
MALGSRLRAGGQALKRRSMSRLYTLKKQAASAAGAVVPAAAAAEIDFKAELNEQQYAAVTSSPGQALVLAGAGSGKTRTLTYRVAYLLANAVAPHNILLLTFTNKAAREMLERVEDLLPGQTHGLWSGTFHSVCNRMLREHASLAGLTRGFTILDSEDARSLLTKAMKDSGIPKQVENATGEKFPKAPVVQGLLSYATNTKKPLEDVVRGQFSPDPDLLNGIARIAKLYDTKKRAANSLDFDDMLTRTLDLFVEHPGILHEYQHQFQFLLVDEYQDTNPVQSDLIDALAGQHGNVMVVGDDAQSIYSWRGADFRNIIGFPRRFPNAQVFRIETNYRSVPEILHLANEAIRPNIRQFPKTLRAARGRAKQKPVLAALYSPQEQALFVAQRMRELNAEEGIPWNEMAVLYRAHFQSMDVQLQLTQDGVPFIVTSGLKFFETAHIKDFSAFLKLAANLHDEASFDRIVRLLPGVGPGTAAKMWQTWQAQVTALDGGLPKSFSIFLLGIKVPARAEKDWQQLGWTMDEFVDDEGKLRSPASVMKSVWEGVYNVWLKAEHENYESRRQDVEQFMRFGERFESLHDLLSELSLLSGPEVAEDAGRAARAAEQSVCLSSVHQAKGLEWRVVFIVWLTDSTFPNLRALESGSEGLEEERRLFYVAITRARDELYLLYPKMWPKSYTGEMWQTPSRFLENLPRESMDEWRVGR